jgi:hypothetical protein
LGGDLFQVLASGKKASAFGGAIRHEQLSQASPKFKERREQQRGQFEHAGKLSKRAKRKSPEKRFREN